MNRGFSLIELIVSMGIMAIITSMGVAVFMNVDEKGNLKADSETMAVKIMEMRTRSFSGQKINGQLPRGGYGIAVNKTNPNLYFLFGDTNGDCLLDGGDIVLEKVNLSRNINFNKLNNNQSICYKLQQITNGVCLPGGRCGLNNFLLFNLLGEKSGQEKIVKINLKSGLVAISEATRENDLGCPAPYHIRTMDDRCVWSCGEGTTPDNVSLECVCQDSYIFAGYDQFGRRICSP